MPMLTQMPGCNAGSFSRFLLGGSNFIQKAKCFEQFGHPVGISLRDILWGIFPGRYPLGDIPQGILPRGYQKLVSNSQELLKNSQ